jgi:hypothetical protein
MYRRTGQGETQGKQRSGGGSNPVRTGVATTGMKSCEFTSDKKTAVLTRE